MHEGNLTWSRASPSRGRTHRGAGTQDKSIPTFYPASREVELAASQASCPAELVAMRAGATPHRYRGPPGVENRSFLGRLAVLQTNRAARRGLLTLVDFVSGTKRAMPRRGRNPRRPTPTPATRTQRDGWRVSLGERVSMADLSTAPRVLVIVATLPLILEVVLSSSRRVRKGAGSSAVVGQASAVDGVAWSWVEHLGCGSRGWRLADDREQLVPWLQDLPGWEGCRFRRGARPVGCARDQHPILVPRTSGSRSQICVMAA
jgi:hypothetical protein